MPLRPRLAGVLTALLLAPLARANDYDLKRLTPVPPDQPIPAGDFFRPPLLTGPQINHAGTRIAAVVTAGEDHHLLMIYDLKRKDYSLVGGNGDYDIAQIGWLSDDRVIFQLNSQKLWGIGIFAVQARDPGNPYPLIQYAGASIVSIPRADRATPLVWMRYDGFHDRGIAGINSSRISGVKGSNLLTAGIDGYMGALQDAITNNDTHVLKRWPLPPPVTTGYYVDRDGNPVVAQATQNGISAYFRLDGDQWVKCPIADTTELLDGGDRPGTMQALPPHQQGSPKALRVIDLATGQFGETLVSDPRYDFVGWVFHDPADGRVIGARTSWEGPHTFWFTDEYKRYQDVLNHSFPGVVVNIAGSNDAKTLFLIQTYSDRQPVRYSWVDFAHHQAGLFKDSAPWIDPQRMQAQNIIRFPTRDGKQLDAYLTLPAGTTRDRPVPLIVLPHGGPWARDNWGFDGEAQFFASRGYAVLKPNYRGSPGFDWMLSFEDRYDFVKMSQDVTDATKSVLTTGLIDPARVAIMGGSFGGYLSLKGVVDEPDLYHAAVVISGVFDWEQLIKDKKYDYRELDSQEYGFLLRHLGDPRKHPEKFDAIAPVRHVDRVRVPVFVSHGGDDLNVDVGQATRLIGELEKYHVPHETDIVGNEGHGMYYFTNRVALYTRILAFLDQNLRAAPGGKP